MKIGYIGLGKMGANMCERLLKKGYKLTAYDQSVSAVKRIVQKGAHAATSASDLVGKLSSPKVIWMMVPHKAIDTVLKDISPFLQRGDTVIDGANAPYKESMRRASEFKRRGIAYLDAGISGGPGGAKNGACVMVGGDKTVFKRLEPLFRDVAAKDAYGYFGSSGAGHFVKMVHNGIEYGLMAAYAEGLNILRNANAGKRLHDADAETTPLRNPEYYQYDLDLPQIAELWRRGSVIGSWLLDLTAVSLANDPGLRNYAGRVSDSGEGRWTIAAAIDEAVPAPVLSAALYERFSSRGDSDFANRVLSAMRKQFGGHDEKKKGRS